MRRVVPIAVAAIAAAGALAEASVEGPVAGRLAVGHGLSVAVPPGWHVTRRAFTPCTDPVERFSVISGREILMLQERQNPSAHEAVQRPRHFAVHGAPTQIECCSIDGRRGWVISFADRGRVFYAYLYPGGSSASALLGVLDSLRVSWR